MAPQFERRYHRRMRNHLCRAIPVAVFAILSLQCSSSGLPQGVVVPDLALAQVVSQIEVFNMAGPISVPYIIQIENPNGFAVVLDRLRLRTIGAGAYDIRDHLEETELTIGPGQIVQYRFAAPAIAVGGQTAINVPTNVRITAFFESEAGSFRSIETETVGGFAGSIQP